jgi:BirA family biotin operon repressor/biotin-[acetyl-CoA-carboxylase] ligase
VNELGLIVYCGTLPSTQDLAREILQSPPVQIRAVVAEHQTAGRGRYGNRWLDTRGESLLMTLLLPLRAEESNRAGQLAFVLALAVADALREQTGLTVQFKWSNDVLVNRRKLAGILIETASDAHQQMWALAGVGLNLLQSDFPEEIRENATSVYLETGRRLLVEPLAQQLLRSVDHWMQVWRRDGLPPVLIEWRKADVTAGHLYRLPSGETGVARGIDDQGHLQVEVAGQVVAVTSAEPVRGVHAPEK